MKSLIAGIVLIILIGMAGFFYRNVMERSGEEQMACTMEAKICPDGSAVGRQGPACEFAPCPYPNMNLTGNINIALVIPPGYGILENESGDGSVGMIKVPSAGSPPHTIVVQPFSIGPEETSDDVILAHTRFQPADMQAESFERFDTVLINGRTFRSVVIERFEAVVHSAYFLARTNDVLMFEIIEHDVVDWMEPTLSINNLPEHAAFLQMLSTIQSP